MVRVIGCALTMACLLLAPAAQAATPGFGIGFQGGYGESKDAEGGSAVAGGHVLLNFAPWIGVMGALEYKFEEDYVVSGQSHTVKSYPLSAIGRVYLPLGSSVNPYVAAGAQWRLIQYGGSLFQNTALDDSESSFGWLLGAGLLFQSGTEFFVEGLFQAIDPERDIDAAIQNAEDFKYDQWTAKAGFTFYLNSD
jgi:opacity protein-like surface antigen